MDVELVQLLIGVH